MQKSNNFLDKIFLLRSPHDFCRPCHRNLSESWEWLFDGGIVLNFFMFFSGSLTRQSLDGHLVNTHSSLSSPGTAVKGGSRWHRLQIWKGAVWNRYRLMAETSTTTAVFWRVVSAHRLCRLYVKAPYSFSTDECYGSTNFDCFVPGAKWYVCRFCMILLMKEFSHGSTVGAIYIYIYIDFYLYLYIYIIMYNIFIYIIYVYINDIYDICDVLTWASIGGSFGVAKNPISIYTQRVHCRWVLPSTNQVNVYVNTGKCAIQGFFGDG